MTSLESEKFIRSRDKFLMMITPTQIRIECDSKVTMTGGRYNYSLNGYTCLGIIYDRLDTATFEV